MLIFIQKLIDHELSKEFYRFLNCHGLNYGDKIRIEGVKGELIHAEILVSDYLKNLPE